VIKSVRQIGVSLLFCCFGFLAHSQQEGDRVREMFDETVKVEWIRNLEGTVNDMHPISVSLGYDGSMYKGTLTILDANSSFDLAGKMDGDVLVLQEIDANGLHTGYIIGTLEDDRFTAQWWSTDMSRSTDIRLIEEGLILLKDFESRMSTLQGKVGMESFDCIMFIESTDAVSGTWQREDECVRIIGHCEDLLCDKIVTIVSEGDLNGTRILLDRESNNTYRISIENGTAPVIGSAQIVDDVVIRRHAQADYSFIIDFTYPDIVDGGFNAWIEGKFLNWYNSTLSAFENIEKSGPEYRWSQTASGWLDIFLFTDQLVSGLITYYDPVSDHYEREHFIYSFQDSRELKLAELSKKDRNLLSELQDNINVEGMNSTEFKYPVLTKSGFFVCTEFDAIDGDHSAMVSYESVGTAVRRKAFFTKLEE